MQTTRRTFLMQAAASAAVSTAGRGTADVRSVLGPIAASKLGFTLSHEHVCTCTSDFWARWPRAFGGRSGFVAKAVDSLKALKDEGVDTLIDLSPYDGGRDIRLIEEISRKSGM